MKNLSNATKKIILIGSLFLFFSCEKEDLVAPANNQEEDSFTLKTSGYTENDMVMYWNEKTAIVLGAPMIQPSRTRYFAIIQIAVHDVLNNIKPKYERFAFTDADKLADPDAAVASAAYWAIKGLNQQGAFPIEEWYNNSLSSIPEGESKELGKTLGRKVAEGVIANRADDGFDQVTQISLIPPDGEKPGQFRSPITVMGGVYSYLIPPVKRTPNWGEVMKPYVIKDNKQFRPIGPYKVDTKGYYINLKEVEMKGARVNSTRTETETTMARFWSENRPSITWNNFTREAIKTKKLDAWKTARLLALVHVSLAESINTGLNAMYHFYYWRPETAIRLGTADSNNNNGNPSWLPFLSEVPNRFPTPPQPGYPSSFAAYGGSTAEILRLFFESDQTDISLVSASLPFYKMHFTSFTQAANENSESMIYTGWEFRKSAVDGEEMGRQIANYVYNHQFRVTGE
jgi:hypothetical protein